MESSAPHRTGKLRPRRTSSAARDAPTWCSQRRRAVAAPARLRRRRLHRRRADRPVGNLNSSFIGDPARPKTRVPGTGGGNELRASQMIVAMKHEKRRFVEHVDFVTSPGLLRGSNTRQESGLPRGRYVSRRHRSAVFGFDEGAAHEGDRAQSRREREQVQDNTGFELVLNGEPVYRAADRARAENAARARSGAALHRVASV